MNVLVIGGTGFLGRRVTPLLVSRGHSVSGMVRSPAAAAVMEKMRARPVDGDLDVPGDIERVLEASGADALVFVASLGEGHAPTLVPAAERAGIRRAVFVSTTGIFTKLDAASKATRIQAEQHIRESSLEWTIVRPTMIYGGPDDRNVARLVRFLRRSPIVPVPGGGNRLQQPVHVDDLAGLIVNALERGVAVRKTYDAAGREPLTFREVIRQAARAVGRNAITLSVPARPAIVALRAYERLVRRPRLRAEQLERLAEDKAYDISAAQQDLDFDPRSFEDGVRELARSMQDAAGAASR